eukprot:3152310-Amphidinium_carterae.2
MKLLPTAGRCSRRVLPQGPSLRVQQSLRERSAQSLQWRAPPEWGGNFAYQGRHVNAMHISILGLEGVHSPGLEDNCPSVTCVSQLHLHATAAYTPAPFVPCHHGSTRSAWASTIRSELVRGRMEANSWCLPCEQYFPTRRGATWDVPNICNAMERHFH